MKQITEQKLPEPFKIFWKNNKKNFPTKMKFFLDKNNELFLKSGASVFLTYWKKFTDYYLDNFIKENHIKCNDNIPDLKCQCGSSVFELRYGIYEILARCPICKKESSVYEGQIKMNNKKIEKKYY